MMVINYFFYFIKRFWEKSNKKNKKHLKRAHLWLKQKHHCAFQALHAHQAVGVLPGQNKKPPFQVVFLFYCNSNEFWNQCNENFIHLVYYVKVLDQWTK
ncbi:MAG: hypothetical protein IKC13_05195 [Elusimicrobiaceae bacterium]|nr:hypothetical protein [Elusimicrobiaceae bacterium]